MEVVPRHQKNKVQKTYLAISDFAMSTMLATGVSKIRIYTFQGAKNDRKSSFEVNTELTQILGVTTFFLLWQNIAQ